MFQIKASEHALRNTVLCQPVSCFRKSFSNNIPSTYVVHLLNVMNVVPVFDVLYFVFVLLLQCHVVITLNKWRRATHIYVGNLTIIVSANGLSPGRRRTIIWAYPGILLFGHLGTNLSGIFNRISYISIQENAFSLQNGGHFVPPLMCYNLNKWPTFFRHAFCWIKMFVL